MSAGVVALAGAVGAANDVPLAYSVAASSGHVGPFHPSHLLEDKPNDSRSRWTSATQPAHLILRLTQPAVVRTITFGKHSSPNPCNLADFKVYALPLTPATATASGTSERQQQPLATSPAPPPPAPTPHASWVRILRNGLRNDSQPEHFGVRHRDVAGAVFATRYLMVVPLQAFQPKYSFTIWHIALKGVSDQQLVRRVLLAWQDHLDDLVLRLAAKHLRTTGHLDAFRALLSSAHLAGPGSDGTMSSTAVAADASQAHGAVFPDAQPSKRPFEHPIVARLFDALVLLGDFDAAEACLEQAAYGDATDVPQATSPPATATPASLPPTLFERSAARTKPRAHWTCIVPGPRGVPWPSDQAPSARGGASMVVDPGRGVAYLHGGWDGSNELNDLWNYEIATDRWKRIVPESGDGPAPRSCHNMALDARSGIIYLMGHFIDVNARMEEFVRRASPDWPENEPMDARRGLARTEAVMDSVWHTAQAPVTNPLDARVPVGLHLPPLPPTSSELGAGWPTSQLAADLWGFSTRSGRWTCYSHDVAADGGPMLMYGHQMVVDTDAQMLYVFGGRTVNSDAALRAGDRSGPNLWLGMWKYDLVSRNWELLFTDGDPGTIPAREGHAMVLEPSVGRYGIPGQGRRLWILGGHRAEKFFDNVWTYDLHTHTCSREQLLPDPEAGMPIMGVTPHAAIDVVQGKIYLFSAEAPPKKTSRDKILRVHNELWVLDLTTRTWGRVWQAREGKSLTQNQVDAANSLTDAVAATSSISSGLEPENTSSSPRSRVVERQPVRRARSIFDAFRTQPIWGHTPPRVEVDEPMEQEVYGSDEDDMDFGLGPYVSPAPTTDDRPYGPEPRAPPASSVALGEMEMLSRWAQSMIFVPRANGGEFIVFGGTVEQAEPRLGDTWKLSLAHAPVGDLLRQARFAVRQRKFQELLKLDQPDVDRANTTRVALAYLQSAVASVVDQYSPQETATFRDLSAALLHSPSPSLATGQDTDLPDADDVPPSSASVIDSGSACSAGSPGDSAVTGALPTSLYSSRLVLFRSLLDFFPSDAIEPGDDLLEAVARLGFRAPL